MKTVTAPLPGPYSVIGSYSESCYPARGPAPPDASHARAPSPHATQIEASRRNGARSNGPVTAEGKARASRNALKHGLCAMRHLVLEDEVPDDLEALIAHLTAEVGAATEIEARLARRLAIAFWKGERAERIEVALFDAAPKIRPPEHGYQWEQADPLTTFDVRRFNAIRGQQAQIGREIRSCLKELRALRKDAPARTGEPEQCEAQDARHPQCHAQGQNRMARSKAKVTATTVADELLAPAVLALRVAIAAELAARRADPERDPAIMDGLMRDYWVARTGLPVLEAG